MTPAVLPQLPTLGFHYSSDPKRAAELLKLFTQKNRDHLHRTARLGAKHCDKLVPGSQVQIWLGDDLSNIKGRHTATVIRCEKTTWKLFATERIIVPVFANRQARQPSSFKTIIRDLWHSLDGLDKTSVEHKFLIWYQISNINPIADVSIILLRF